MPQLKAVGLIDNNGKPVEPLVHDLRDDATYSAACTNILEGLYPPALREAWNDPEEDAEKVAAWFMRNAKTGAAAAKMQAKLYLLLLKGDLPTPEEAAKKAAAKKAAPAAPAKKAAPKDPPPIKDDEGKGSQEAKRDQEQPPPPPPPPPHLGPNLHIDLQIHIAADASDTQIDTIFKSMAKHLSGRD